MFLESFKTTGLAVIQIMLLAGIGYTLAKKGILNDIGLGALSRLVVEVALPVLIFCQLTKDFSFSKYPHWWLFPLMSIFITFAGLFVGSLFVRFIKDAECKKQFLSLIAFQNSGYLPMALIAALLPADKLAPMFIYLFLFLMGFNLVIWSFGVYMLSFKTKSRFELTSLFSPPVVATLFSLLFVFLGLNKVVPDFLLKPLRMIGETTIPLAMLVVGGNLAQIHLKKIDKKAVALIVLAKLIIMPGLGLCLISRFNLSGLIGLFVLMQLAVPPATSLSVIMRHYKKEDLLISQGIFFGHMISIISLPIFLSLYFSWVMIK